MSDARPVLALDVGGVLLSAAPGAQAAGVGGLADGLDAWWERRLGLPRGAMARRLWFGNLAERADVGAVDAETFWRTAAEVLGVDAATTAEIRESYLGLLHLDPRVEDLVRAARARHTVVTITNGRSDARSHVAGRFGLDALVDVMVISAEVGHAKPDPEIYLTAARMVGAPPEAFLFIDDVQEHVDAAAAVGMRARHAADVDDLLRILEALPA